MAKYVLLLTYTDQGIREVADTTKRAAALKEKIAGKFGVKVSEVLWTLGQYDLVILAEAPNDETMTACSLSLAKLGNVKTQTLRAFQSSEVDALLQKL
ncbi:MAG TPA: GYD domain-containing protein [Clostridia bacterium]|nr:GYD domain-containing protein [Clostridia bacterium]